MNNKVLFLMKTIKNIIEIFINTFFVMYYLELSEYNVVNLGLYYIIVVSVMYGIMYLSKNMCKNKNRIDILRFGIVFNFIYLLLLFLFNDEFIKYIYIMAIVYGIEEGLYYSAYNNLQSTFINKYKRKTFFGIFIIMKSLISIIIPIIYGITIDKYNYNTIIFYLLIIVTIQLLISYKIKDNNNEKNSKVNIKQFKKTIQKIPIISKFYKIAFWNSFIFNGGFNCVITLYIIKSLNTTVDLGIYVGIIAIISSIIGYLFAKRIPKYKYGKLLKIFSIFVFIGITILMIDTNFYTVILFNLLQVFASTLYQLTFELMLIDISNHNVIKYKYKVEYYLEYERKSYYGRVFGYIMYILLGIVSIKIFSNLILMLFTMIIILVAVLFEKLEKELIENLELE